VDIEETSYLDTGLQQVTTYTYTVSVVDTQGDVSPPSDPSQATTQAEPVDDSFDGTGCGRIPKKRAYKYESVFEQASDYISGYWTGPWPTYHLFITMNLLSLFSITLHFSFDFFGWELIPDGNINLFTPLCNEYGYSGEEAIEQTRQGTLKVAKGISELTDPWDDVNHFWLAVLVTSFLVGISPVGALLYAAAVTFWILSILRACVWMLDMVNAGVFNKLAAGEHIVEQGLWIMVGGGAEAGLAIITNMAFTEGKVFEAAQDARGVVGRDKIDDIIEGAIISAIVQIIVGVSVMIFGLSLAMNWI